MNNLTKQVPIDYEKRLYEILDLSWKIFYSQFLNGRHAISTEAPFQHHFANIISNVGSLYCISRNDQFFVDLETKCENIRGKTKYIDITCSLGNLNSKVECAIELKFKTQKQTAEDEGRKDVYRDLEALELVTHSGYHFGKFYMITDSGAYLKEAKQGLGNIFSTYDGFTTQLGKPLSFEAEWLTPEKRVEVILKQSYTFNWKNMRDQNSKDWYFLDLIVKKPLL